MSNTYTQKELLELAGISRQRFHERWTKRGLGPKQVQGGKGRLAVYDAEDAEAWLAARFLHNVRQDQLKHQTTSRRTRPSTRSYEHAI